MDSGDAFVVNVYDTVSMDIDVPESMLPVDKFVYSSAYEFQSGEQTHRSKAYRFRLQGIAVRAEALRTKKKQLQQCRQYIRECLRDTDNWVSITVKGVDIYHRILGSVAISRQPDIPDLAAHLKQHYPDLFCDY